MKKIFMFMVLSVFVVGMIAAQAVDVPNSAEITTVTTIVPASASSVSIASSKDVEYVTVILKPMPGRSNYGSFIGLLLPDGKADLCFADDPIGCEVTESISMKPGDYLFNMVYSANRSSSWATDPGSSLILSINGIDNVIDNSFKKTFVNYDGKKALIYAVRIPSSGPVSPW